MTVFERHLGRETKDTISGLNAEARINYVIVDVFTEPAARFELQAAVPLMYGNLILSEIDIEPLCEDIWDGVAIFRHPRDERSKERPDEDDTPVKLFGNTFDVNTQPEHINLALDQEGFPAPGLVNLGKLDNVINVRGGPDGEIEGTDILVPRNEFTETWALPDGNDPRPVFPKVDAGYIVTLNDLAGKTNEEAFRGFFIEEVLFLGAQGFFNSEENWWEINFRFAVAIRKGNVKVGDITIPSVEGWRYVWALYEDKDVGPGAFLLKQPVHAFKAKIYETGDFSQLGIGV